MNPTQETTRVLIDAWKLMVARMPAGEIREEGGVVSCVGNVPLPFLNLAVHDHPLQDAFALRRYLDISTRQMADCAYPTMRIVCTDWAPEDWEKVVNDYGLSTMMYMTGMEAGELLPPRRPAPDIDIRRVDNEDLARHAAMINAHAYGMPAEMFECIANMRLWHDDSCAFVGFTGERPVSCAAAFPVDNTVYIALVATMPDSHGNGYAEAVMRHTVVTGQREMGTLRTTLHATDMGRPVYQAMGYTGDTRFAIVAHAH